MRKVVYSIAVSVLIPCASRSQVLYDINFQTPDQGVNQTVLTGSAPQYISSVLFGNPEVVPSFAGLTDQPLLFDSIGESPTGFGYYYTQIQLDVGLPNPAAMDLSFDFTDVGSTHLLTILFDTPDVRNFQFYRGAISFINPVGPTDNFGTYTQGQDCHFDIHLDYQHNEWTFYENGVAIGSDAFDPSGDQLRSIRFNYDASGPNTSGTAIDNVIVTVPEPAHLTGLALAFGAVGSGYFGGRRVMPAGPHLSASPIQPAKAKWNMT